MMVSMGNFLEAGISGIASTYHAIRFGHHASRFVDEASQLGYSMRPPFLTMKLRSDQGEAVFDLITGQLRMTPSRFRYPITIKSPQNKGLWELLAPNSDDPELGRQYSFRGDKSLILAHLNPHLRIILRKLKGKFELTGSRIEFPSTKFISFLQAHEAIDQIHRSLLSVDSLETRYARNALEETVAEVRYLNTRKLVAVKELSEFGWRALEDLLCCGDIRIATCAAERLQHRVVAPLVRAIASAANHEFPFIVATLARYGGPAAIDSLLPLLDRHDTGFLAAVELARLKHQPSLAKIVGILAMSEPKNNCPPLIDALGYWGTKKANGVLTQILTTPHLDEHLYLAVIKALATCGTSKALEPLMRLEKSKPSRALKSQLKTTIGAIRSQRRGEFDGFISVSTAPSGGEISPETPES